MTPARMAEIHGAAFTQSRPWHADEFTTLLSDPQVIAFDNTHGFALWRVVLDEAELLTIAIAPTAQGRGHGRALMRQSLDALRPTVQEAFLEVAADNQPAIALYTSMGFATVGQRPRYYTRPEGHAADAHVMRLDLHAHVTRNAPKSIADRAKSG